MVRLRLVRLIKSKTQILSTCRFNGLLGFTNDAAKQESLGPKTSLYLNLGIIAITVYNSHSKFYLLLDHSIQGGKVQ